jgi:hypothetical protein
VVLRYCSVVEFGEGLPKRLQANIATGLFTNDSLTIPTLKSAEPTYLSLWSDRDQRADVSTRLSFPPLPSFCLYLPLKRPLHKKIIPLKEGTRKEATVEFGYHWHQSVEISGKTRGIVNVHSFYVH